MKTLLLTLYSIEIIVIACLLAAIWKRQHKQQSSSTVSPTASGPTASGNSSDLELRRQAVI